MGHIMMVSRSIMSWAALALLGASAPLHAQCCFAYLNQWGSFGGGDGQFFYPYAVTTDAAGDVYVVDTDNYRIQKFSSNGAFLSQWGSVGTGNGQFDHPTAMAIDAAGDIYVADRYNHRIQKFSSAGVYQTQWGTYGSGDGQFIFPVGVAFDGAGDAYVVDRDNHRIQKFTNTGTYLGQWGSFGSGDGEFNSPWGLAINASDEVYVADRVNHRIQKFNASGVYLGQWGSVGNADGQFLNPTALAFDAAGNVYVADATNDRIQEFTAAGEFLCKWGHQGPGDGEFWIPTGVAVDAAGYVYVTDFNNHRIQKFGPGPGCNESPVAVCNGAVTAEADGPDGALVQLDGSQSSDPDGDPLTCHWDVSNTVILDNPEIATPSGVFPVGITTATLTVTDGRGGVDICDVVVTVQDTTPPQVQCTSDLGMLWPPDHKMRTVKLYIVASDIVGLAAFETATVTIRSDEADDATGNGDGATTGDVNGSDGYTAPVNVTALFTFDAGLGAWTSTVQLRAERAGDGDGRCYTIEVTARDAAGNQVVTSCCIVVPHDQRPW